jgi:hypothetical protein
VIKTGLKLAGPIIRGIKGFAGKVKAGAKKLGQKALAKVRGGEDKGTESSRAVRAATVAAVIEQSKPAKGIVDLRGRVQQIESNLKPQGLRSAELVRGGKAGSYDLLVQASKKKKEATVIDHSEEQADVTASAKITFKEVPKTEALAFGRQYTATPGENLTTVPPASHPGWRPIPASIKGGKVDRPAAGSTSMSVTTYSGKSLRVKQTNASHAERHMADFLYSFRSGTIVIGVELQLRGDWTPCRNCARTLTEMAAEVRKTAGEEPTKLTVDCRSVKLHPDWNGNAGALKAALVGWDRVDLPDGKAETALSVKKR